MGKRYTSDDNEFLTNMLGVSLVKKTKESERNVPVRVTTVKKGSDTAISLPKRKAVDISPLTVATESENAISEPLSITNGNKIKQDITNVLANKYGSLNVKNLFEGIDDKDVEDKLPLAKDTIETNIKTGKLETDFFKRLPNLTGGLALSYAAADKGLSKATTRAREAAYMEGKDSEKKVQKLFPSGEKLNTITLLGGRDKKPGITFYDDKDKRDFSMGIRFKAEVNKQNSKNEKKTEVDFNKAGLPKNLGAWHQSEQKKYKNNLQFNSVSKEQQEFYDRAKKEGITAAHAQIKNYAEQWDDVPEYKWTIGDIVKWKTKGGDEFIHQKKLGFINNYKDVIKDAAKKYDIPEILLAGVAYIEYGGDPMFADDVIYSIRDFDWSGNEWIDEHMTITKNPDLTSFGNTSIQVRRALEMLGYDSSTNKRNDVIKSLKDPIQNIYLAACHLNVLRNIDYKEKSAAELSDDEIKIIASRYNIGPQYAKEAITTAYGEVIYANKNDIIKALEL